MTCENPIKKFSNWFEEAKKSEPELPEAMSVSTVSTDGQPSSRMVLMKSYDQKGFVFFTNLESRKGKEIYSTPKAALLFYWKSLKRQVRIEGQIFPVSDEEADAYFASRPRGSQIGAWASDQSRPMSVESDLEQSVASYTEKFSDSTIKRPPFWSGLRLKPQELEFWQDRCFRLHLREVYRLRENKWNKTLLYP
tara:strand:+ start:322 stop:903 length:582 start_codon:yes stop_codon:yes gene_type:complete